jgi:hypothetical protein
MKRIFFRNSGEIYILPEKGYSANFWLQFAEHLNAKQHVINIRPKFHEQFDLQMRSR